MSGWLARIDRDGYPKRLRSELPRSCLFVKTAITKFRIQYSHVGFPFHYQLAAGAKISILKRATTERTLPGTPLAAPRPGEKIVKPMEDWWLVRDSEGHVGWVLGRMIDLDVPLDVAQYAEGQRIVACLVLNEVVDVRQKGSPVLTLLAEPKDGMPFDYNQARVFTWNVRRHRYETAYREHNLNGVLPVRSPTKSSETKATCPRSPFC